MRFTPRRRFRALPPVLLALVLAMGATVVASPGAAASTLDDEAALVASVNQVRHAAGLAPVATDARLVAVARRWSARMATDGRLAHNPNLGAEAPAGDYLKENVGVGGSALAVHDGFMGSRTHRDVIVHPMVTAVGIGVVHDGPRVWVTQVFLRPPVVEPVVSAASARDAGGDGRGYRVVASDGSVATFGPAGALAGAGSHPHPVTGAAATPSGAGLWLVDAGGRVTARGDAPHAGGMDGRALSAPIVGIAPTPSGQGYWLLGRDGGIFSFGDAGFFGSTGDLRLNQPVVAMAATPTGRGYWFVASDGGIFSFGDAGFFGSTGDLRLNQPVVGMARTGSGGGYWLVARDGGVFTFGDAPFLGSTGDLRLAQPIVGIDPTTTGRGYRFVAADAGVFTFGDAAFLGSMAGTGQRPAVALVGAA